MMMVGRPAIVIRQFIRHKTEVVIASFNLGMPSKKKNSIWRDIVPTRGGEGVKKCEMSLLKIPFY